MAETNSSPPDGPPNIYAIAERRRMICQKIYVVYAGGPCIFCRRDECLPGYPWLDVAREAVMAPEARS